MKKEKGAQIGVNELILWIVAILLLVLIIFSFIALKEKGINMAEFIKNILKFK